MNAPERRSDESLLLLVKTIHSDVKALDVKISDHIATEPEEWAIKVESLMFKAFADGDADGHRRAHEAQIKAFEDRAAFWAKLRYELARWGLIGFSLWVVKVLGEAIIKMVSAGYVK